jgi:hypothetical protein
MGLSPRDVDCLSLWQFAACMQGWNRAQGSDETAPLTDDEFDQAAALAGWDD